MDAVLDNAVERCPFLARVAAAEGPAFARTLALDPTKPVTAASAQQRRPVLEELQDYSSTFRLWHGAEGFLPLPLASSLAPAPPAPSRKLVAPSGPILQPAPAPPSAKQPQPCAVVAAQPLEAPQGNGRMAPPRGLGCAKPLPLASMSLSFGGNMPDFGKFLKSLQQHHDNAAKQHVRRVKQQPSTNSSSSSNKAPQAKASSGTTPAGADGLCPLRKMLGPVAPLVFNPKGHIQCPEAIVRARAALAATKPVRELRPQSLPIKLLAVGATTAAVNVPCGMAREHTEKFSFGWFVAVHASIPFIAMLRKAVIMPKYAILFTIATAIAGQAMGARMERRRMQQSALSGDASPAAAAAPIHPTAERRATSARLVLGGSSNRRSQQQPLTLALANTTAAAMGAPAVWSRQQQQPQGIAQAAEAFKLLLGTDGAAAAAGSSAAAAFSMGRPSPRGTKGIVLRQGQQARRAAGMVPAMPLLLEARA